METNSENVRGYQFEDVTFREYAVRPSTWDDNDRGFDAVVATENPVLVYDVKSRKIVREILRMDGAMLPADFRLPLQDSHQRGSVRNTLGSSVNLRIENGQLLARNVISSVESAVATKVKEGHITANSLGYVVLGRQVIEPGQTREIAGVTYRADTDVPLQVSTRWRPIENSLTPVGADESAKFRSSIFYVKQEEPMAETVKTETVAAPPQDKPADAEKDRAEVVETEPVAEPAKDEKARSDALLEITPRGYENVYERAVIDGMDVEAYRVALREEHSRRHPAVGTPEPTKPEEPKKDGPEVSDAAFVRMF